MTTKTGIVLAWGGMSFIDTWPNINSVCDLPGLFGGNFWCGGFCRCSLLFLGGGGGWWWFGCYCFCCCCSSYCCGCSPCLVVVVFGLLLSCSFCLFFVFFVVVVVVVVVFLFFVGHSTPKGKNETKVCFPVFWGPLSPFPFFCSCLLIFLVVSLFFLSYWNL